MPGLMHHTTHRLAASFLAFVLALVPGVAFAEGNEDDPAETADSGHATAVRAVKTGRYPVAIPILETAAAKRNM